MGRFIKISHTLFSLPLVLAGMLLAARGWPAPSVLALALLAAAGARTAAMALNRIIDREIDARNARTAGREIPAGVLSLRQAWAVALFGIVLYLGAAALLGPFLLLISPIPLAVFVLYPYLKRFTPLCHFGVGAALGLSPLGGWLAVTQTWSGSGEVIPVCIFGILWVAGFDIIYATLDTEFDRAHGVHSIPAWLGVPRAIRFSGILHAIALLTLLIPFFMFDWSPWSLPFLALAGVLLWLEHREAENVELAFFHLNIAVGFAVLAFVLAGVFIP